MDDDFLEEKRQEAIDGVQQLITMARDKSKSDEIIKLLKLALSQLVDYGFTKEMFLLEDAFEKIERVQAMWFE